MKPSVCLVTTGQPSTNPRAVKEADALVEAGYEVRLIGAQWADWADAADERLLSGRPWQGEVIRWKRSVAPARFWWTRGRHHAARAVLSWPGLNRAVLPAAVGRITPELTARARQVRADLYIAHNLGALPAAAAAARRWGSRLGFDAEDFHSGQFAEDDRSASWRATRDAEARWIPACDYVTAAAPGIARAYATLSRRPPRLVRNVFPRADRPAEPGRGSTDGVLRLYWFSQTIGPGRGLEDVVEAMKALPVGTVELHVRGVWWPGFREALERSAPEGATRPIVVTHAPADPGEMVKLSAPWDVGIAPETGDTENSNLLQSNKAYTYLLAGVPLLASDTDGNRELLSVAAGAGWLYPRRDVRALSARLGAFAADRTLVREAAAAAWQWGDRRLNWETEQAAFLEEVERAFSGRPRSSVA